METQNKPAQPSQGGKEQKEVKAPNFYVKDETEKEILHEVWKAGKDKFLSTLPEGYAKKLGTKLADQIEGKLNKSLGK